MISNGLLEKGFFFAYLKLSFEKRKSSYRFKNCSRKPSSLSYKYSFKQIPNPGLDNP